MEKQNLNQISAFPTGQFLLSLSGQETICYLRVAWLLVLIDFTE